MKQRKEKQISFSIENKEYGRHEVSSIWVLGFVYVCVILFLLVCVILFLLVFSIIIFFFRRLSTILLTTRFLFLNVTYAKIFVRYEVFVIFYFVTFVIMSDFISQWEICSRAFQSHAISVSNKITNRFIFKINFFIDCTSVIAL